MNISSCLIIKNEEHCLERCLKSLNGFVDEIIIVDTGSTDNSLEIAKKYTDKIYHSLWRDDFSFHRNESLSYATGDWLLIIDADEEFYCSASPEKFKEGLEKIPENINSASITMDDIQKGRSVMKCNSARLFRNGSVHYEGIVHNQPKIEGPSAIIQGVSVFHYGYDLPPDKMQAKYERTVNLLLKQYEDKSNPHVEFYLCQIHGQYGNQEESRKWGKEYIERGEELGDAFNNTVYFTMTKNYIDASMFDEAWDVIKIWLKSDIVSPDMGLAMSDFGAKVNDLTVMAAGCRRYLKDMKTVKEQPNVMGGKFCFSNREDLEALMLYRLAISCFQEAMTAWNGLKPKLELLENGVVEEMDANLKLLGLDKALGRTSEKEEYNLPKLMAI